MMHTGGAGRQGDLSVRRAEPADWRHRNVQPSAASQPELQSHARWSRDRRDSARRQAGDTEGTFIDHSNVHYEQHHSTGFVRVLVA